MQLNIIEECDGGFTQPSAVSGIRQDIMKPKEKKEENTVNRNSKDAGIQFRDYVEQTQDDINDYINVAGWDSIPSKTKVKINEFQTERNIIHHPEHYHSINYGKCCLKMNKTIY